MANWANWTNWNVSPILLNLKFGSTCPHTIWSLYFIGHMTMFNRPAMRRRVLAFQKTLLLLSHWSIIVQMWWFKPSVLKGSYHHSQHFPAAELASLLQMSSFHKRVKGHCYIGNYMQLSTLSTHSHLSTSPYSCTDHIHPLVGYSLDTSCQTMDSRGNPISLNGSKVSPSGYIMWQ